MMLVSIYLIGTYAESLLTISLLDFANSIGEILKVDALLVSDLIK